METKTSLGQPLQRLEIPAKFLVTGINIPQQPIHGIFYAYQAVLNDIKNNTQFAADFKKGVRMHKLLDNIKKSAAEGKTIAL